MRVALVLAVLVSFLLLAACATPQAAVPPTQPLPTTAVPLPTASPARLPSPTARPAPPASPTPPSPMPATPVAPTPMPTSLPAATSAGDVLLEERLIAGYTVRLWQPAPGTSMYNHATLAAPGQPEVRVESVSAIGTLPAEDVNGDGFADLWLETYAGGSHCCWGTVLYSLGPSPAKLLDILSLPGVYGSGSGTFEDLGPGRGDGVYEFVTRDPLLGIPCSGPSVKAVLQAVPGQGYVGAGPLFPEAYAGEIAAATSRAEGAIEQTRDGYKCGVYDVIVAYLYSGQEERAWQELQRLYLGPDPELFFDQLQQAVAAGRFYTPARSAPPLAWTTYN